MKGEITAGLVVLYGAFIVPICILAWQAYVWLRHGAWPPMDCVSAMLLFAPNAAWLNYPSDWVGLHKALSFIHSGVAIFITGFGLALTED